MRREDETFLCEIHFFIARRFFPVTPKERGIDSLIEQIERAYRVHEHPPRVVRIRRIGKLGEPVSDIIASNSLYSTAASLVVCALPLQLKLGRQRHIRSSMRLITDNESKSKLARLSSQVDNVQGTRSPGSRCPFTFPRAR